MGAQRRQIFHSLSCPRRPNESGNVGIFFFRGVEVETGSLAFQTGLELAVLPRMTLDNSPFSLPMLASFMST